MIPIEHFLEGERGLYVARAWRETPTRPEAQLFRDWLFKEPAKDEGEPATGPLG